MIDLHAHSSVSDGSLSPGELVGLAKDTGLAAVAITDHDSIFGIDGAREEAEKRGITLVRGIEFSASYGKERLIHILGLGIDHRNERFLEIYREFRETRAALLDHVFRALQGRGLPIGREEAEPFVADGFMDRQAIAKSLVAGGYAPGIPRAWIDFLDRIPYVPGELIPPRAALEAIRAAGGKSFLAHFHLPIGLRGYSEEESRRRLGELKEWGLDGMEYYYPSYSAEDRERCGRYIEDFRFLRSGGTDFHGANRPHIRLGIGEGDFSVPDGLLEKITPPSS